MDNNRLETKKKAVDTRPSIKPLEILTMFALLTAPEISQATPAQRFMVEVASNALDHEGIPLDVKTIDVVVTEHSKKAIASLIAGADWLKGYSLVNYWSPEDGCPEF